jgi:hypothetical protein
MDMGGLGSGWKGTKKEVVEHCIVVSIKELIRNRVLVPGNYRRGTLVWGDRDSESAAWFNYESDLRQGDTGSLFLRYVGAGEQFCHWVSLRSTVPNYGGRRWWFLCPIKKIRVAKLYLPPGATCFACRQAHDLTYTSCQESGSVDRLCRKLAPRVGRDEAELRALFKHRRRA